MNLPRSNRLERIRHTAAHVLAQAVTELYPQVKLAIGPTIEHGFYYDMELPRTVSDEDLGPIEARMRRIIQSCEPLVQSFKPKAEALALYRGLNQPFKVEIIEGIDEDQVSFFTQGNFFDLCRGPHVEHTGDIPVFKLLKVAGAYWRGDEKNPMLQRFYGTAWETQADLDAYLSLRAEAEQRDHRKLGPALDLFHISDETGPGLVYWHPRGATLRHTLEAYSYQQHIARGYQPVMVPHLARQKLWETSGHAEFYRENMFFSEADGQPYVIKPMNCPEHIMIYKSRRRSYRELPLRYFEFGTVYRFERSGVMHGLLRVRGFTQDDGHIFCTTNQLGAEITQALAFVHEVLNHFGFSYEVYLSTRPSKFVGKVSQWDQAEAALSDALRLANVVYRVDPGEGVFYGPKIDVKLKDALGRVWQGPTIQVDFNLPDRFHLEYTGPDSRAHTPVMVHRAIFGSFERFIGALIEHYAGAFPLWLAPVQVVVLPIADDQIPYALSVAQQLRQRGYRVEVDQQTEKIGAKIREATLQKIPYMLVVGKREEEKQAVSLRHRTQGDLGVMTLTDVSQRFSAEDCKLV